MFLLRSVLRYLQPEDTFADPQPPSADHCEPNLLYRLQEEVQVDSSQQKNSSGEVKEGSEEEANLTWDDPDRRSSIDFQDSPVRSSVLSELSSLTTSQHPELHWPEERAHSPSQVDLSDSSEESCTSSATITAHRFSPTPTSSLSSAPFTSFHSVLAHSEDMDTERRKSGSARKSSRENVLSPASTITKEPMRLGVKSQPPTLLGRRDLGIKEKPKPMPPKKPQSLQSLVFPQKTSATTAVSKSTAAAATWKSSAAPVKKVSAVNKSSTSSLVSLDAKSSPAFPSANKKKKPMSLNALSTLSNSSSSSLNSLKAAMAASARSSPSQPRKKENGKEVPKIHVAATPEIVVQVETSQDVPTKDPTEILTRELLDAIKNGDRTRVETLLEADGDSDVLQILLTYSHANRSGASSAHADALAKLTVEGKSPLRHRHTNIKQQQGGSTPASLNASPVKHGSTILYASNNSSSSTVTTPEFYFDMDILQEVHELLGKSVSPLNLLQIACILGEEDIALALLECVYRNTGPTKKLLLMEFLGKAWGDGNTTLHLASFQGMSKLVERLLDLGANTNKANHRGYKPVDCADCDQTCALFRDLVQVERLPTLENRKSISLQPSGVEMVQLDGRIPPESSAHVKTPEIKQTQPLSSESHTQPPAKAKKKQTRVHFDANIMLFELAKSGDTEALTNLFHRYPLLDVNLRHESSGMSALHFACAYGHMDTIRFLVEQKQAELNICDREGWSVLHCLVAEIPEPGANPRRQEFLQILAYFLQDAHAKKFDIHMRTGDEESILDVVRQDEVSGEVDAEVMQMLEKELAVRSICLEDEEIKEEQEEEKIFITAQPTKVLSEVASVKLGTGKSFLGTPKKENLSGIRGK